MLTLLFLASMPACLASGSGEERVAVAEPGCNLEVAATGASFLPTFCRLEQISGGAACPEPSECTGAYALSLKAEPQALAPGGVASVTIFGFRSPFGASYRFDRAGGEREFEGELIGTDSVFHHLVRGSFTIENTAEDRFMVAFDLTFSGNIGIRGSGTVPMVRVAAP